MHTSRSSASLVALALASAALLAPLAGAAGPQLRSVGEIFVDAQGRANGENIAARIVESQGLLEGVSPVGLGEVVFETIAIDDFAQAEKIGGVGSPAVTLRGSNALVSLHDNLHSEIEIRATRPVAVTYHLGPGIQAAQEGAHGGIVRLTHSTKGDIGHIVVYGTEGPASRGETLTVRSDAIVARLQGGSEILFLAKAPDALVEAIALGLLASHYVSEFEGREFAASQVDLGAFVVAHTTATIAGGVQTTLSSSSGNVLAYDLDYETLAAKSASNIVVYVDGQLAKRVSGARDVLASAQAQIASYHALVESGRARVLASVPQGGEHRVSISASANASTESQSRAEGSAEDDARVYGGFEYQPNGKLTGEFLTSVIPESRATLLSFTPLSMRTEVFRSASFDGGAKATFHAAGAGEMRLSTPNADLTLVDDALATMILSSNAPVEASYELANGIRAFPLASDIITLDGPNGPAGALVLIDDGASSLRVGAGGAIEAKLGPDARLVYRGAPDAHASEEAVLRALAAGRVGAQVLAGVQGGALATKSTSYADGAGATILAGGRGALQLDYATDDASRALVIDARGAALVARAASDIRVSVDGVIIAPAASAEQALDARDEPRYHASTSAVGALRVIVGAAAVSGQTVRVLVESVVEETARAQAGSDAFGAFRVFHDGAAVGSYVALKADQAAGAVTGLTMVGDGRPIFTSLVAGDSPFLSLGADGASVLKLENREARLEFTDSTNGFARIVALRDTDAAFRLGSDLAAQERTSNIVALTDGSGEHVASLVLDGAGSFEDAAAGEIRAHLGEGAEILFRTHAGIEAELSDAQRAMMNSAIAAGRVAGQVTVQSRATAIGATSAIAATYGDAEILTAATKDHVEITIDSMTESGKTLIVSLDPHTIPGMARGKASIRFDGEVVAQAASYADILEPMDDGGAAEYFVLAGDAGTQVLVSIPHFSVHTVTLDQETSGSDPLFVYATVLLAILVVVESALLVRRRVHRTRLVQEDPPAPSAQAIPLERARWSKNAITQRRP